MNAFPAQPAAHDAVVVKPSGKLNMVAAPQLRARFTELIAGGHTRVVVDLSDVDTIDSAVLGVMVSGLKSARQAGGDLRIVGPGPQVQMILGMTKLLKVLPAYPSVESAFAP